MYKLLAYGEEIFRGTKEQCEKSKAEIEEYYELKPSESNMEIKEVKE